MRTHKVNVALAVALLTACASGGGGGGTGGSANLITREQLEAQGTPQEDAYTIIQRLHPNWLRPRSATFGAGGQVYPAVFFNGSRYGELDALRSFHISELESIEYIGSTSATTQFGTGYSGGVIMVRTARR